MLLKVLIQLTLSSELPSPGGKWGQQVVEERLLCRNPMQRVNRCHWLSSVYCRRL